MILLIDTDDHLGKFGWNYRLTVSTADEMTEAERLCRRHGIPYAWKLTKWPHIELDAVDRSKLLPELKVYRMPNDTAELLGIMKEWER